jgi:hypothetical protein
MKPLNYKNYGSIPHLSSSKLGEKDYYIHEGQERILTKQKRDKHDKILVFEKYDGSNVGIAKKNGEIYALTRSGYEAGTSQYRQHHEFEKWVCDRALQFYMMLDEGERLVGEWMYQAHGTIYHIEHEPIVFFDYFDASNQRKTYQELMDLGLDPVFLPRLLHEGDSIAVQDLIPVLNQKTPHIYPIDNNPEGMVYRVERNGQVDFLAKWVRKDYQPGKYIIDVDDDQMILNEKTLK